MRIKKGSGLDKVASFCFALFHFRKHLALHGHDVFHGNGCTIFQHKPLFVGFHLLHPTG